jgi:hypothetical protein
VTRPFGDVFAQWKDIGREYGPPTDLPNTDAGKRLIELGLDDETMVSRLRITATPIRCAA